MPILIKRVLPLILLAAVLVTFFFTGCNSYTKPTMPWTGIPPENLTQQQLQDILSVSLQYHDHLETYKLYMMTNINTDVVGGSNPWKTTLNTGIAGAKNVAEDQTQITLNISINMVGMGQTGEEQNILYDMYALDDWLYMNMTSTTLGSYWIKVQRSSELEKTLNLNTAKQQIKLINSPSSIEYLRTEEVNGVECYVLSISPNKSELANWLDEQATSSENLDWQNLVNDSSAFKDFTLYCYLAKDSYLIMRMTTNMVIELSSAQAGANPSDFDTMKMSLNIDMLLYDHNVPYTLTLPEAAASAEEVSSDIFSN